MTSHVSMRPHVLKTSWLIVPRAGRSGRCVSSSPLNACGQVLPQYYTPFRYPGDSIGRRVTQQGQRVLPTIANGTSRARRSKLCGRAIACWLTGTFQLLLHQPHTRKGTPLERLHSPWLETPTAYLLHGCRCGQPARPRVPRWRAGRQRPGAYRGLLDRDLRLQRHQDDAVGAALVNQQIPLPGCFHVPDDTGIDATRRNRPALECLGLWIKTH